MFEKLIRKFNKKRKDFYKADEVDLSERVEQEMAPVKPPSLRETILSVLPEMDEIDFGRLESLSEKVQNDIINDIREKRRAGMPLQELLERFDTLIHQSLKLQSMTSADSDTAHRPEPTPRELQQQREADAIKKSIKDRIEEAEKHREEERSRIPSHPDKIN